MGKKKGGSEPVPAPPALPPSSLPAAESSELVHGEAVLPPGFEEAVPFDQLFLRNKRVSFHPLFRSAESSVTALGGVLTYSETKAWQQYGETAGFVAAKHPEGNGIAHRDCGRLSVEDDTIAAAIFSRLAPFLPPSLQSRDGATWNVCGCSSNLRLYKYGPGQRFGRHYDESVDSDDGQERTFFTVLLYLNGSGGGGVGGGGGKGTEPEPLLRGGGTNFFYDDGSACCSFLPRRGFVLLHEHGDRCLLHEGAAVTEGHKYLLRTDVAYRRGSSQGAQQQQQQQRQRPPGGGGGAAAADAAGGNKKATGSSSNNNKRKAKK
jgi:hypothetical protein